MAPIDRPGAQTPADPRAGSRVAPGRSLGTRAPARPNQDKPSPSRPQRSVARTYGARTKRPFRVSVPNSVQNKANENKCRMGDTEEASRVCLLHETSRFPAFVQPCDTIATRDITRTPFHRQKVSQSTMKSIPDLVIIWPPSPPYRNSISHVLTNGPRRRHGLQQRVPSFAIQWPVFRQFCIR